MTTHHRDCSYNVDTIGRVGDAECLLQRLAVYEDGWMKGEHGLSCIEDISVTTSRDRQTP